MSISEFYNTGEHIRNVAHFTAMVNLARADGNIQREEEIVLGRLAVKLNISDEEFKVILKKPQQHPFIGTIGLEERIERIRDLFSVIYADFVIDKLEEKLIIKYAIALGFPEQQAREEIDRCKRQFDQESEFKDLQK